MNYFIKRTCWFLIIVFSSNYTYSQVTNNILIKKNKDVSREIASSDNLEIFVFGSGGIRSAAEGNSLDNNSVNGALGATFIWNKDSELTIGFSVNEQKSIQIQSENDFGSNLLLPDINGRSFTLNYSRFLNKTYGINFEAQIADSKWKIDDNEIESSPSSVKLNIIYAPFGNLYKRGDNFITLAFTGGVSSRRLLGNIANLDTIELQNFETQLKSFIGVELGAHLVLNSTKVFFSLPFINAKDNIDGLTGGQVVIGATISGNLLKL